MFVDGNSMIGLKSINRSKIEYMNFCEEVLFGYRCRYFDYILNDPNLKDSAVKFLNENMASLQKSTGDDKKGFNKFVSNVLNYQATEHKDKIMKIFQSFLHHVVGQFVEKYKIYFDENEFETRAVVRITKVKNNKCEPICTAPANLNVRKNAEIDSTGTPRTYHYSNSLIEFAFENKTSAVYSAHKNNNYFTAQNFDDFIVIVPNDKYNMINIDNHNYPIISFVYSVRIKEQKYEQMSDEDKRQYKERIMRKLLLMQFANIEQTVSKIIKDFVDSFSLVVDADQLI